MSPTSWGCPTPLFISLHTTFIRLCREIKYSTSLPRNKFSRPHWLPGVPVPQSRDTSSVETFLARKLEQNPLKTTVKQRGADFVQINPPTPTINPDLKLYDVFSTESMTLLIFQNCQLFTMTSDYEYLFWPFYVHILILDVVMCLTW